MNIIQKIKSWFTPKKWYYVNQIKASTTNAIRYNGFTGREYGKVFIQITYRLYEREDGKRKYEFYSTESGLDATELTIYQDIIVPWLEGDDSVLKGIV